MRKKISLFQKIPVRQRISPAEKPKTTASRLLFMALTLCIVMTMLPVTAAAEDTTTLGTSDGVTDSGPVTAPTDAVIITAFGDLAPEILNQSFPLGEYDEANLTLPATLTAADSGGSTLAIPVTWTCEDFDPNEPGSYEYTAALPEGYLYAEDVSAPVITVEILTGDPAAAPTDAVIITAFGDLAPEILNQSFPLGEYDEANLTLPATLTAADSGGSTLAIPVTWTCEDFDPNEPGSYEYTAALPEGYLYAENVAAPVITVEISMGISLMSEFGTLATPIEEVTVTMKVPAVGDTVADLDDTLTLLSGAHYTVQGTTLTFENGTWIVGALTGGGRTFSYNINLKPKAGFSFTPRPDNQYRPTQTVTVNGNVVTDAYMRLYPNGELDIFYTFTLDGPAAVPPAPNIYWVEPGDKKAEITMFAGNDGGSELTRFEFSWGPAAGYTRNWETVPYVPRPGYQPGFKRTVEGLTNGVEYTFEARAVNAIGAGAIATETVTPKVPGDTVPPKLSNGRMVTRDSDTRAVIGFTSDEAGAAWILILDNLAAAPSGAAVRIGGTLLDSSVPVNDAATTYIIDDSHGLTAGAKDLYVVVQDAAGNLGAPLKIDIPAYGPQDLNAVTVTMKVPAVGDTVGDLDDTLGLPSGAHYTVQKTTLTFENGTWIVGALTGGGRTFSYNINLKPKAGFSFTPRPDNQYRPTQTVTVNGNVVTDAYHRLYPNGELDIFYTFTLNDPAAVPPAPNIYWVEPGDKKAEITMFAGNDGGSEITRFEFSWGPAAGYTRNWETVPYVPRPGYQPGFERTVEGLTNGVEYTFEARAVNAIGAGAIATETVTPEGSDDPFTTHPADAAVNEGTQATFTVAADGATAYRWQASENNGGSWLNVTETGGFSDTQTAELTVPGKAGLNNCLFRCVVTVGGEQMISKPARLTVAPFVAVTDIGGLPSGALVGEELTLSGTAFPGDATNRIITWEILNAGTTGATLDGSTFKATAAGTAQMRARVEDGRTTTTVFVKAFDITVVEPEPGFVPVTSFGGYPWRLAFTVDVESSLNIGAVQPSDATNKDVVWSVKDAGGTGAVITGAAGAQKVKTTDVGTFTLTATIADGLGTGTDYTTDFAFRSVTPGILFASATVARPVAGEHPSYEAIPGGNSYTISEVTWYRGNGALTTKVSASDVFDLGQFYTVLLRFNIVDEYGTFGSPAVTVNGNPATYNSGSDYGWSTYRLIFTADPPPDNVLPMIVSITPSGAGVPVSGDIEITFSELMAWTAGTVLLDGEPLSGGDWVPVSDTYRVPYSGLAEGTSHVVSVAGFRDYWGNEMVVGGGGFTTAAGAGTTPTIPPATVLPTSASASGGGNTENSYRVLFETSGGGTVAPVTGLSYGDRITVPPTPVREGYTFGGWYKDEECTFAWTFAEDAVPGDMTLYARWVVGGVTPTETAAATASVSPMVTTTTTPTTVTATVTTTAAESPAATEAHAPVFGVLAGLAAAGVLMRRRL